MKDLGAATAYAYAVEEGYTGTEEEFAALMADFTTAAETATAAAEAAEAAAASLTVDDELDDESTNPVQNAVITNELSSVKDGLSSVENNILTANIRQALLQIAEKVAYIDEDGQDYYDDLYDALYPPAPPAELVSISAVYTQSGTVYDTDTLDSLKSDLVVTATYDDSTTATVTTYTLSGTLAVGTSTITVTYEGKTDTFNVTVSEFYTWKYLASDGVKLSARSDLGTVSIANGGSETLSNNLLNFYVPHGNNLISRFNLAQTTNTKATLSARVKFNAIPVPADSNPTGFRMQLSHGTTGVQVFVSSGNMQTYEGNNAVGNLKQIDTGVWYTIEIQLDGSNASIYVDGALVRSITNLSSHYCTANAIILQSVNVTTNGDLNVDIDWIRYINED